MSRSRARTPALPTLEAMARVLTSEQLGAYGEVRAALLTFERANAAGAPAVELLARSAVVVDASGRFLLAPRSGDPAAAKVVGAIEELVVDLLSWADAERRADQ